MQRILCAVVLSGPDRFPEHNCSPWPVGLIIGSAENLIPNYANPDRKSIGTQVRRLWPLSVLVVIAVPRRFAFLRRG